MENLNYAVSSHDKFRALCAISTSDSLTSEERRTLDDHLATCDECRQVMLEYEALARTAIPTLLLDFPEDNSSLPEWSVDAAKQKLFHRLDLKPESPRIRATDRQAEDNARTSKLWPFTSRDLLPYAATLATVLAVGAVGYRLGSRQVHASHPSDDLTQSNPLRLVSSPDPQQLKLLHAQLDERDGSIASLDARINSQFSELQQLKIQDQTLRRSIQEEQTGKAETVSELEDLKRKLGQAESDLAAMQNDMDSLRHQRAEQALHLADLEAQSAKFPAMLKERDETIAQQRELLDRDRDIRDLMGARQLYVGEVTDVGRDGKTKKPFGRVFYTKGKSLIFYAYDLDQQPHVREASTFQAWGHRGPDLSQATSLGIFYADNTANKRWVVKFDDAKSLEQIDAVFVTVEPKGGSRKPSSAGFLFTYLGVEPNHP